MNESVLTGYELLFLAKLAGALVAGYLIGTERERRGKPAGVSTHTFVIGGAMLFALLSRALDAGDPGRIAAQIVSGVGFLGAGIILKGERGEIRNLTTAASIWFSAGIGMAIGFGWYVIAAIAVAFSMIVPRIPHATRNVEHQDR
jgi:putative Mg2+ transporter-C (MgtC) family protein